MALEAVSRLLARCDFPIGNESAGTLACAVSGGADSLALVALAAAAGCDPVAYHVDHGLRPGSESEIDVVRAAGDRLGIEVVSLAADVGPGPNLEARARAARYDVLPDGVATGHTADDQAETVLINMLRGSAADGLSGMAPGPRHPILRLRRAETRELCSNLGIEWLDDPSNADARHVRNRVRYEVLPLLNDVARRDVVPVLCRQAELLADDVRLLEELSGAVDVSDARRLAAAPLPLARRAVRRWLRALSGGYPPSSAAVGRVLGVAAGDVVACEVSGGLSVRRSAGRLRLHRRAPGEGERHPAVQ